MEAGWSCAPIEQHRDAGGAKANFDDCAGLVGQIRAPQGTELTNFEAGADDKPVAFLSKHFINPNYEIRTLGKVVSIHSLWPSATWP
ncbi:hypothetical protein [Bradyrhizobium sp. P5_C11_2]